MISKLWWCIRRWAWNDVKIFHYTVSFVFILKREKLSEATKWREMIVPTRLEMRSSWSERAALKQVDVIPKSYFKREKGREKYDFKIITKLQMREYKTIHERYTTANDVEIIVLWISKYIIFRWTLSLFYIFEPYFPQ